MVPSRSALRLWGRARRRIATVSCRSNRKEAGSSIVRSGDDAAFNFISSLLTNGVPRSDETGGRGLEFSLTKLRRPVFACLRVEGPHQCTGAQAKSAAINPSQ